MKKIFNLLGKIILIICIITIIGYGIKFIVGILDSYNNGTEKTFLFGGGLFGPYDTVYRKEAVNLYLSKSLFDFAIISMFGILPGICVPIFVTILIKFKKIFSKKTTKYIGVTFIICILFHVIAFNDVVKYDILLCFLPYIESLMISYLIAIIIFKSSNEK